MKKKDFRIIALLFGLFLIFFFNAFIFKIFAGYTYKTGMVFGIFLIMSIIILGYQKNRHVYELDILQVVFIYTVGYLILLYLSGLFFGFIKNVYSLKIIDIIMNITPVIFAILYEEIVRYVCISKIRDKKTIIYIAIIFAIIDILLGFNLYDLKIKSDIFEFCGSLVLGSIVNNILVTYITYKVGYIPTLVYRYIMTLYVYMLPIIPDVGIYINSVLSIVFPTLLFLRMNTLLSKNKHISNRNTKLISSIIMIPVVTFLIVVVLLTSNLFKISALAIGSNSMYPYIQKGDVVVYDKIDNAGFKNIEVGDVLVYNYNKKTIVHRVTEIIFNNGHYSYVTKGDNNKEEDRAVISEKDVIGTVIVRVRYLGIPTIWLNEKLGS